MSPTPTPLRPVPTFTTEAEEQAFWEREDSTEFVDWRQSEQVVFPNLKSSVIQKSILLRGENDDN